jgi:hypothetical protein
LHAAAAGPGTWQVGESHPWQQDKMVSRWT